MICAGIDAGSRAVKIILLDRSTQQVIASGITDQAIDHGASAMGLLQRLLKTRGLERGQITRTVATGYARGRIRMADTTITEITCHAVGVRRQCPEVMTILEIGGQDSKLIRLDTGGNVRDFAMNDRCAAGTGRFLEIVAERLETKLESLGQLAADSRSPATISSTCVVFAETEIIGLLASGVAREDIVAGIQHAMASRMAAMAGPGLTEPVVFTGGVALIPGMREAMARALEREVAVAPEPQMTGALGAALLAAKGR
jgi:(R)-2-hydroxyacyl-CoA dehydratese activating ATPase